MKPMFLKCLAPAMLLGAMLSPLAVPASAQSRNAMTWSGDVDDTTIVYIHETDVRTQTVSGKSASNVSTQRFDRLPRGPFSVDLRHSYGRGFVRVIQQPNPANDFTAAVRLRDPQPGRSHYEFTLSWQPLQDRQDRDRDFRNPGRRWRGSDR